VVDIFMAVGSDRLFAEVKLPGGELQLKRLN
jgi:hypothetical protein